MTDLKISQFANGGAVQITDEIATNRAGTNTKVFVGSMAAEDAADYTPTASLGTMAFEDATDYTPTSGFGSAAFEDVGTSAGNVVQLDGSARLPAVDGSQLTNLPSSGGRLGKNLLINSQFIYNQRSASSVADDVYGFDRWYALTQTAALTVSSQSNQENGQATNIRLTQPQASAQRIGHAQIVQSLNCRQLRGSNAVFSGRFRSSAAQAIRFAVLEWTGTADSVTSDVVNDWTSGTYTAGNFFLGSNLTVTAVAAVTPSANTWTDFSVSGAVSASANNIIVMVWTEGTFAQNATLDLGLCQLESGVTKSAFEYVPADEELLRCQYYLPVVYGGGSASAHMVAICQAYNTSNVTGAVQFPTNARTRPTGVTVSSLSHFGVWNSAGSPADASSITFVTSSFNNAYIEVARTGSGLTAGNAAGFVAQNASASLIFTGCEL